MASVSGVNQNPHIDQNQLMGQLGVKPANTRSVNSGRNNYIGNESAQEGVSAKREEIRTEQKKRSLLKFRKK